MAGQTKPHLAPQPAGSEPWPAEGQPGAKRAVGGDEHVEVLNAAIELIAAAGYSFDIDDAFQVYVNRDLRMSGIEWVGFDMDYTLALYRQDALDALSVKHTVDTLIDHHGYPSTIASIEPRPDFAIRGLVIDTHLGNILKMDSHYYVGRVFHGLEPASREVRKAYQNERVKVALDRYVLVDSLFSLPETFLYAAVINHLERDRPHAELNYARIYRDVRAAIDRAHADGRIKREILGDLARYVVRDPELSSTLHKFRSAGKHLFLLTNSEWYYSREVMAYLLDDGNSSYPGWQHYFEVAVTSAMKPAFFRGKAPFKRLDHKGRPERTEDKVFERGAIYEGGNVVDFERMLKVRGSAVLYVGDHIYGDIVRSKRDVAWRTAMIIQEMETELIKRSRMVEDLQRWADLDQRMATVNSDLSARKHLIERLDQVYEAGEQQAVPPDIVRTTRAKLQESIDQLARMRRGILSDLIELDDELSVNFNPYWGLLFKEGAEHSVFGGQVESYACLYTSRVSNFRRYSPMQYFRARRQIMPHEF